ncbi:MAG TPA: LAGLIDADG family homing endonuclease [Burkholderiales bacterium]|nr:LAGLIDADG family homing endonuclease [Burkholderiales bacterium]
MAVFFSGASALISGMAAAIRINRLTPERAAYLAGLIDGEGTITLTRMHAGENRRLVVSISNNDLSLLKFVRATVGAGKITSKKTYSEFHARSFAYQISSRQALALLGQFARYLRTYKADRANLALKDYLRLTPRNGRYTPDVVAARRDFERQLLAIKG